MNYDMHPKMKYLYVGIDTHKLTHTATIKNCFNDDLASITFNNDKKGYESLTDMVNKHEENGLTAIYGLEDTKHLGYGLSSYLLSKNCVVKIINSTLTYNERKKNPIIDKTDKYDSECIAKVLLDELDKLPNAESNEIYWTLKQLVKMRKAIVKNNVEYKNKLHAQLLHHYPNYNKIFSYVYCPTALELWFNYPSPDLILNEDKDKFIEFINKASKKSLKEVKANQILELIKEYDIKNKVYQEERNCIIKMLVKQIKNNDKRLLEIEEEIIAVYDKTGKKLHSYPCLAKVTSADILSEIGNINRFKNSGSLAKYAGIAPVNRSSGKNDKEVINEFGNRDLNTLIYSLACRSLSPGKNKNTPLNAIFSEYYYKKCNSGKTRHQAIVCVMRRIINIIYRMLKDNQEYQSPTELLESCKNSFKERKLKEEHILKEKQAKKEKHKAINQT